MRLIPLTCLCLVGQRRRVGGYRVTCFCCSSTLTLSLPITQLLTSSFPTLLLSDNHVSFQQLRDAQYLYQSPNFIQLSKTHLNSPSVVAYQKRSSIVIGYQHKRHRRRIIIHIHHCSS